ncbi:3-hydroxyacyl-CoA dehydrogenase/enoyl-CoA hydratase family protein [Siphonobacter sp. SORGH_AS_0500]|uniref:3-hydroxyacyl-CoA dehydrogenase/enoyl-CoA hydratase family protein n=1 Tax=Siphonobacter sp. SORGH_AS_0500 TaxID=1864824 RepID=UPI00285F4A17|nr:3-hydroxyacyl-CoA dehydrogenase/enoyl-CoA hydratase family protein [Siphonobacter sp. SORGH_AS_0500]MDR6194294.1 3-hydroxyacyl-CoA dehydrogenase [Siphonobacter sp. SORGH_AS_0500]
MHRLIQKIAVLGSGELSIQIAFQMANANLEVLLLGTTAPDINPSERISVLREALQRVSKTKPHPLYARSFSKRVLVGTVEEDFHKIQDCDWVIEAVEEKLETKKNIFEEVDTHRKPGSIVSSATQELPIKGLIEGRSEDFRRNFCVTNFFQPVRYVKLLELIPTPQIAPEVIDSLQHFCEYHLGKTVVLAKDTPAFIANRVGMYSLLQNIRAAEKLGLSVEEIDLLTAAPLGRPKAGTFRAADTLGIHTLAYAAQGLAQVLSKDESRNGFQLPGILQTLLQNKWLGDSTGQGFYKKEKTEKGASVIQALDLPSLDYRSVQKLKIPVLEAIKKAPSLEARLSILWKEEGKIGEFYRTIFAENLAYVSHRIPEIADGLYQIDQAVKAGLDWHYGWFELWESIGIQNGIELIESLGKKPADWVYALVQAGKGRFYTLENTKRYYYDIVSQTYQLIPGQEGIIILDHLRNNKEIWSNAEGHLWDLGEGVIGLEAHSKMNTFGLPLMDALEYALTLAEKNHRGLVIGNDSTEAFSAGVNLGLLFVYASQQKWEEVNQMINRFQQTMMRVRYSSIPVVVAPHTLALGGGCEISLHADQLVAAAETYMGLVEVGVGLIPAGGGTKEMALRCSDLHQQGDEEALQRAFTTIATAKVSGSAQEALEMNFLRSKDQIVLNRSRLIAEARNAVVKLADQGYTQASPRTDVQVMGKKGIAAFEAGIAQMRAAHFITEHDQFILQKLAYVISGGNLDRPQLVSEQYLLDLEREAFLSLSGELKTLERIQQVLTGGKAPRN